MNTEELADKNAIGIEGLAHLLKNSIELLARQERQAKMRVDEIVALKRKIYKRGLHGAQSFLWESRQDSHGVRISINRRDPEALCEQVARITSRSTAQVKRSFFPRNKRGCLYHPGPGRSLSR